MYWTAVAVLNAVTMPPTPVAVHCFILITYMNTDKFNNYYTLVLDSQF